MIMVLFEVIVIVSASVAGFMIGVVFQAGLAALLSEFLRSEGRRPRILPPIMLTYIALNLILFLGRGHWYVPKIMFVAMALIYTIAALTTRLIARRFIYGREIRDIFSE